MKEIAINALPQLSYAVEEALNRLRVNISFCGRRYRKIMVISGVPNEGKSFIALQVWRMFSESGKRSVLLDADMRKSVLVDAYELSSHDEVAGMSDYLSGSADLEDVLCTTNIQNGCIVPNITNVINPSLLLENGRMQEMLQQLEGQFDYVFVDSPPLDLVSDGERIGSMCDGAVLVIRGGSTPKGLVENSIRQLQRADCPLLGVVLNRVQADGAGYYSKRYGGGKYYGRYKGSYYYG